MANLTGSLTESPGQNPAENFTENHTESSGPGVAMADRRHSGPRARDGYGADLTVILPSTMSCLALSTAAVTSVILT